MATQFAVLLIGRSLTLTAIAAGLRSQSELAVRQVETWAPLATTGHAAPDVVIVDAASAPNMLFGLLTAYPHILLLEVGASAAGDLQVAVHHCEQRPLGNGHDLVALMMEHALAVRAAGAVDVQIPRVQSDRVDNTSPVPHAHDHPSLFTRSVS